MRPLLIIGGTASGKSLLARALAHEHQALGGRTAVVAHPGERAVYASRPQEAPALLLETHEEDATMGSCLRWAVRTKMNLLVADEVREEDAVLAAQSFARTGHCVVATLHALDLPQAEDRWRSLNPPLAHIASWRDLFALVVLSERAWDEALGTHRVTYRVVGDDPLPPLEEKVL